MASLTDRQKKKMPFKGPVPVMLEPDLQATSEADWLEAFTMVETDAGGTLRIRAKSLGAAPASVRVSTRAAANADRQYCHLIAPGLPQAHPHRRSAVAEGRVPRRRPDRQPVVVAGDAGMRTRVRRRRRRSAAALLSSAPCPTPPRPIRAPKNSRTR